MSLPLRKLLYQDSKHGEGIDTGQYDVDEQKHSVENTRHLVPFVDIRFDFMHGDVTRIIGTRVLKAHGVKLWAAVG